MKKIIYLAIIGIFSLASCKSTTVGLQRATATSIGNTLSSEVTVKNIKRGMTSVSWEAKKKNQCFKCEADDMVRRTNCVKVECEN